MFPNDMMLLVDSYVSPDLRKLSCWNKTYCLASNRPHTAQLTDTSSFATISLDVQMSSHCHYISQVMRYLSEQYII